MWTNSPKRTWPSIPTSKTSPLYVMIHWLKKMIGPKRTSLDDADNDVSQAVNVTTGCVIAERVQWAGTSESRRRGLLGRSHLDANEGIYLVPTQWIHMFGMRFPIDVAFLDSSGRVISMHHSLKPNRLSRLVWRADGALELTAGKLRSTNTSLGDVIKLS